MKAETPPPSEPRLLLINASFSRLEIALTPTCKRPEGDRVGTNILTWLLGDAYVRLDVWSGNHGGTKNGGVGP